VAGTGGGVTPRQRHFGDKVRQYRHEKGWSQERLAHEAVINRTYVASLEAGQRNPSLDLICRLAKALHVGAADLVKGAETKKGRS